MSRNPEVEFSHEVKVEMVLRKARELLARKYGWCQDQEMRECTFYKPKLPPMKLFVDHPSDTDLSLCVETERITQYCVIGALNQVGDGLGYRYRVLIAEAARRVSVRLGIGVSIPVWNDWPGRTQAEVVELFDSVIADCAEGR